MGTLAAGAVVLVPFPFSDLSGSKLRPAVVLADVGGGDVVLCQVTSTIPVDSRAVKLTVTDFARGSLQRISYARPGKLFTASRDLAVRQIGALNSAASERVVTAVIHLLLPRRES